MDTLDSMEGAGAEPDARWASVVSRDSSADGQFFFSVETTGVYCRPSCSARRANPKNVRFHRSAADAEAAGFRPCKKCQPDQPSQAERYAAMVTAACRSIEATEEQPTLAALAAAAGLSRYHFHRVFRAITGVTPKGYGAAHRAQRVRDQLAVTATVTEAIYGAGFNSSSRFYEKSQDMLGMTPTAWRAGGVSACARWVQSWWRGAPGASAPSCWAMIPTPCCANSRIVFRRPI
ncbi:MAG: methylphosphotriester-DNA--protein-cysteine methyltransferase family protein [Rhodospirillales bacterium]|nr:methylphosphotriester-DNA--protein-cysteine methyltransferase family protein [Rhodospirillales bacterium]